MRLLAIEILCEEQHNLQPNRVAMLAESDVEHLTLEIEIEMAEVRYAILQTPEAPIHVTH